MGYVTLEEAAKLENITYETMKKRIMRNRSAYATRQEKRTSGGRPVMMVSIKSLSQSAQHNYGKQRELKELETLQTEAAILPEPEETEEPWYLDVDITWYLEHYKEHYYKALERKKCVEEYLRCTGGRKYMPGSTEDKAMFANMHMNISQRTLYRYLADYTDAKKWADRRQQEDGTSYDHYLILALARKPKEKGRFPSFDPAVKVVIHNIWFDPDFARNRGTVEMLYDKLSDWAEANRIERIPSYASVVRYVKYLMIEKNLDNDRVLLEKGLLQWRNEIMVKNLRDTSNIPVLGLVMGDEHTFDCWVTYKEVNGKESVIRPVLVAWIDIRTRCIIGDVICKHANSQILKDSLLKLIYQDGGGVPEYLLIDNGKDYTSREMRGTSRNDRRDGAERQGNEMAFDDKTRGFYASIGIKDDHRALPYQPWTKGNVERFFSTVCNRFTKWLKSYTGTLTGSRTDAKVNKDTGKMQARGELLTMDEFYKYWSQWLEEKYHQKEHSGLKKAGETWITPRSLWENCLERYQKPLPAKRLAAMLMMKAAGARVNSTGITKWGYNFMAPELYPYINKNVDVRWDTRDVSRLYVYTKDSQFICEAESVELLDFVAKGKGVAEDVLLEHLKNQKRHEREAKERIKEMQTPLEELYPEYVGYRKTTGGLPLMIGKQPEKKSKIVAMPEDKTFRQNEQAHRQERKPEGGSYLEEVGLETLELLRAMEN